MTIGERIREYRKLKNMSMAEFGERLGISGQAISQIELGKTNINERIIKTICSEFNISREWLETGEGEMELLPLDDDAVLIAELVQLGEGHATKEIVKALLKLYLSLSDDKKNIIDTAIETAIEATKKDPE